MATRRRELALTPKTVIYLLEFPRLHVFERERGHPILLLLTIQYYLYYNVFYFFIFSYVKLTMILNIN